jgi:DNA-binding CsgD family transcriptional regulator
MGQTGTTRDALDACYEAVFAQADWPVALDGLAKSIGAVGCSFHARDAGPERLQLPASPHYHAFLKDFYTEGWWQNDHRGQRAWPQAEAGRGGVFIEHDVASDEERRRLPVYHELYPRYDVPWWAGVTFYASGRLWAMPFLRSRSQGPFLPEERPMLAGLAPHLARIVTLAQHVAESSAQSALRSVQELNVAALLCDRLGHVVDANDAAHMLLGDDLGLRHGVLIAADPASQADLSRLIQMTSVARSMSDASADRSAIIRRRGATPLIVDAVPAAGIMADAFGRYGVLLLVRDPGARRTVSEARMRTAFGLTRAEARLAALVGSGLTLQESAAQLAITANTAKTLLKLIFSKMGISRQAALVRIAERLGPAAQD